MSDPSELPPLDPTLAALVAAERDRPLGPDLAQRARLRARLAAGLVLPALGATAWSATATAAPKVATAAAAAGGIGKPAAIVLAVAIGAGGVVGIRQAIRPDPVSAPAVAPRPVAPAMPDPVAPAAPALWTAERALLQQAREALVAREGERALALVAEHERRFPAGLLAEEREALRVQALVSVGRLPQARAAAARFEAAHPGSVHRDAIRRAIAPAPKP